MSRRRSAGARPRGRVVLCGRARHVVPSAGDVPPFDAEPGPHRVGTGPAAARRDRLGGRSLPARRAARCAGGRPLAGRAGRSSFVGVGLGPFYVATSSGLAAYDTTLLSVHMVQHMVLSMVVPLALALGAPVTLALRTLPRRPRRWLLAVLHSRVARVLSFPPLTLLALRRLAVGALLLRLVRRLAATRPALHELMHVHLVVVGALFFWPLVGIDPVPGPGRLPVPGAARGADAAVPRVPRASRSWGRRRCSAATATSRCASRPAYAWLPTPRRPAPGRRHPVGGRRPGRARVLRGAVRAVGALVDAGGRARGPAARPAGGTAAERPTSDRSIARP